MGRTTSPAPLPAAELAARIARGGAEAAAAIDRLNALTDRAEAGDQAALAQAVAVYDALPSLWPAANLLQAQVEAALVDALVPADQLFTREVVARQLERMRAGLLGPAPSPLDRLLADRVVLCWLDAVHADAVLARAHAGGASLARLEYLERRAERAQRRSLRAIQAMVTVRRLLAPTIQLNLAEKQINVAR